MKRILLQVFSFIFLTTVNAQYEKKIDISKLVKIVETSDFPAFVKLVKYLSYEVMDSSKEDDGSLIFITMEQKLNGNVLGCTMTAKKKMNHASFSTWDSVAYSTLKKQIKGLGFSSSGISKSRHFPEIIEAEDFENGKMLISAAAMKRENGRIQYEFTFIRW